VEVLTWEFKGELNKIELIYTGLQEKMRVQFKLHISMIFNYISLIYFYGIYSIFSMFHVNDNIKLQRIYDLPYIGYKREIQWSVDA